MTRNARLLLLGLPLGLAACGGTTGFDSSQVQALAATSQAVAASAANYATQATTMTSASSCAGMQGAYDAQVRPMVGAMQGMGPSMDEMMGSMNHMADADMECGANAMMAELDRHRAMACASSSDMAPNVAEAGQHAATMTRWADHQAARAHEMGSMMGMGGMMGGSGGTGTTASTGRCVRGTDGSYTIQP